MSENNRKFDVTMSQSMTGSSRGGDNAKSEETRKRFLFAFERTFGNISASCEYAGLSRRTFYRWMNSRSRINRKFQKKIAYVRPLEKLLDLAEAKLQEKIEAGEMRAIELILRTRGKSRGYGEETLVVLTARKDRLMKTAAAFLNWLNDNDQVSPDDMVRILRRFSEKAKVDEEELADEVGLKKLLERCSK